MRTGYTTVKEKKTDIIHKKKKETKLIEIDQPIEKFLPKAK